MCDNLLHLPEVVTQITNAMTNFLELNDTLDISISTLWDTLKAITREELIVISAVDNKRHREKRKHLSRKVRELKNMHQCMGTLRIWSQLKARRKERAGLDLDRAEYASLRLHYSFYIGYNKCGCLLANRLSAQQQSRKGGVGEALTFHGLRSYGDAFVEHPLSKQGSSTTESLPLFRHKIGNGRLGLDE
ncbi:hypothetical protein NDU88_005588 [Pleurodeles waltl]|uniref:Uncharacterized protein n=1 Tax=Pleurodeles waltl TaxID=8319 RepID=A0AAV7WBF4_PLEWA|nr:hypothetical protein NDU88_005588 [Pleurodeles waltl]